jgi:hypothetical protein
VKVYEGFLRQDLGVYQSVSSLRAHGGEAPTKGQKERPALIELPVCMTLCVN